MSLPTGQQRILDGIEDGLHAHDSRLASLFATFTRLTGQEEMPKVEELKPGRKGQPKRGGAVARPGLLGSWLAGQARARGTGQALAWRTGRPAGRVSWIVLLPVVLVAAVSALILGLLVSAPQGRCPARVSYFGSGMPAGHSSACPVRHVPYGRH